MVNQYFQGVVSHGTTPFSPTRPLSRPARPLPVMPVPLPVMPVPDRASLPLRSSLPLTPSLPAMTGNLLAALFCAPFLVVLTAPFPVISSTPFLVTSSTPLPCRLDRPLPCHFDRSGEISGDGRGEDGPLGCRRPQRRAVAGKGALVCLRHLVSSASGSECALWAILWPFLLLTRSKNRPFSSIMPARGEGNMACSYVYCIFSSRRAE